MARAILLASCSSLYGALAIPALGTAVWLALLLGGVAVVGLVSALGFALMVIRSQTDWKNYWRHQLSEIALDTDDDVAYSRSILAKGEVDASPFVPLPAAIGFYLFTFTSVQFLLASLADRVSWL